MAVGMPFESVLKTTRRIRRCIALRVRTGLVTVKRVSLENVRSAAPNAIGSRRDWRCPSRIFPSRRDRFSNTLVDHLARQDDDTLDDSRRAADGSAVRAHRAASLHGGDAN